MFGEKSKKIILNSAILSLILVFILPFLSLSPLHSVLLALILYIFVIAWADQSLGLKLLIITRPCLDILTDEKVFSIGDFRLNFSALIAVLTIIFAAKMAISDRPLIKTLPLRKSWIFFLLIALISIIFSSDHIASLAEFMRLLSIFCLYIIGYLSIKDKKGLIGFIKLIILSAVIPAIFAIWQYSTDTGLTVPFEGIYNRIYGTFAHPNLFAYYLVMPLSLSLFIFLSGNKRKTNSLFYVLPIGVFLTILALTFTRGAWVAFLVVAIIMGLMRFRIFLFAVVSLALLSYLLIDPIYNRVNDFTRYNPESSVAWRIDLWKDSAKLALEKPFFGHGAGVANEIILKQRGESAGSSDPHNDYLKIALENGFVGLLSYCLIALGLFKNLWQRYTVTEFPNMKTLILVLFCLSLAYFGMSAADNILRNTALQWTFWALVGAVLTQKKTT